MSRTSEPQACPMIVDIFSSSLKTDRKQTELPAIGTKVSNT
jgi:hypothetical protein